MVCRPGSCSHTYSLSTRAVNDPSRSCTLWNFAKVWSQLYCGPPGSCRDTGSSCRTSGAGLSLWPPSPAALQSAHCSRWRYLETWRSVRFMENPLRDSQHWRKQQDESSSARKIWCPNLSVTWSHAARLPRPGVMEMKWLYNINGDLKLVFSLVSAGAGFDILGQLVEHNPGLIIN